MSKRRPLAGGFRWGLVLVALLMSWATAASASADERSPRIVGGAQSPIESTPWQVALAANATRYTGTRRERTICGGSLVAPRVVITAAHCIFNIPVAGEGFNGAAEFEVISGQTNLNASSGQVSDVGTVRYLAAGPGGVPVLESRSGPDVGPNLYDPNTYAWDVAVLTLQQPSSSAPILIAGADEAATWAGGQPAIISGWGSIVPQTPDEYPNTLHAATVTMFSDQQCGEIWREQFTAPDETCAGRLEGGTSTCRGDSGGPLVVPVEVGATIGVRLVGAASTGPEDCDLANAPGQFARLAGDLIRNALVSGIAEITPSPIVGSGARPFAPPNVLIAKHPKKRTTSRKARFTFSASEFVAYECKVDRGAFAPCPAAIVERVGRGKHRLAVRGYDQLGQYDASPDAFTWKVKRSRRKGR